MGMTSTGNPIGMLHARAGGTSTTTAPVAVTKPTPSGNKRPTPVIIYPTGKTK